MAMRAGVPLLIGAVLFVPAAPGVAQTAPAAAAKPQAPLSAQTTRAHAEAPGTARAQPAAPTLTTRRETSWIGAGMAIGVLNLPKVGVGVELVGELRTRPLWPLEFSLTYWFENHAELALADLDLMLHPSFIVPYPPQGSRLRVSGGQLSAAVCPFERWMGPDSLLFCLGAQGGFVRVEAEGLIDADTETRATFDLQLLARYHFRLWEGIGISYSAGLFVALLRERFGYRDRLGKFQQAFRTAAVGGRLDLALTYGF